MANIGILIKNYIKQYIGAIKGKTKSKKTINAILFISVMALLIVGVYAYQAYSMFSKLAPAGLSLVAVFNCFNMVLLFLLIFGFMRISGSKKQNDEELLLSLPIKKTEIIIAKSISLYIFDFFITFALVVPYIVLFFVYNAFNFLTLMFAIISIFVLPLLSIGITYICDFIVKNLFNKMKNASVLKSIVSVILLLSAVAFVYVKTFSVDSVNISNMQEYFKDRFVSYELLKLIFNHNIVSLLWILLITLLPFIVGVILASVSFGKSVSYYKTSKTELNFSKPQSQLKLMIKKEFSTYFSIPAYVTNTIIAPIMILAFPIIVSIFGLGKINAMLGMDVSKEMIFAILTLVMCFSVSLGLISCVSVSVEGKQFWILKTSPINIKLIFLSKAMLNFLIIEPAILIGSLIAFISLKLTIIQFVFMLVIPTLFCLINSFGGVFINILFPKLDWDNEVTVVKQSLSVLVDMLFGALICAIPLILFFAFKLSILTVALITLGVYLLILFVAILLLFTKGKKLFEKL